MGIECGGDWQGLLLGECTRHRFRTTSPPKELVYVEFIESAPWNWKIELIGQEPLYRGAGPQLLEMATRWSEQLGFDGRLGLHSLPQRMAARSPLASAMGRNRRPRLVDRMVPAIMKA